MTRSSIWDVDRDRFPSPPLRLLPRAVCTRCGRFDSCPLSLPMPCYHCAAGELVSRAGFSFDWCPVCDGKDPFCARCHGKRVIATRIADRG